MSVTCCLFPLSQIIVPFTCIQTLFGSFPYTVILLRERPDEEVNVDGLGEGVDGADLGDGVRRAEEVDPVLPLRVGNLFSGGYLYSVGTWMRCILDTFTHGEIEMSALPLTMDPKIPPKVAFGSRKVPVLGAVPQSLSASLSSL